MRKLIYAALSVFLLSCSTEKQNGWYLITDTETMAADKTPIVTASDFEALRLDSVVQSATSDAFPGQTVFLITGKVKADKVDAFADATEKHVGKQMGFLYNGEIITAPQINMRIESGHFSITPPSFMDNRKKMVQLYKELQQEIK